MIYELLYKDIFPKLSQGLVNNLEAHYYWSLRFDPEFYIAQARAGFIAITHQEGETIYLLPELQQAYAVLHWENLHIDRSVSKILNSGRLEDENIELIMNPDPTEVLRGLEAAWSDSSWLRDPYQKLMIELSGHRSKEFSLWGVELRQNGALAAGELGYTIGRTYTSLTGFMDRRPRQWNDFGKVQLVLLARELQRQGYAFHNLGHPHMEYKLRLGAQIYPRKDFLAIWDEAVSESSC